MKRLIEITIYYLVLNDNGRMCTGIPLQKGKYGKKLFLLYLTQLM